VLTGRAPGLSAQILRERKGYYAVLEHCQRGDLDLTHWLIWFLEQLIAAAQLDQAVIDAVRRKPVGLTHASRATAWRDLADLVAKQALEPIGAGRSSAYRIRWPC
jgi:Fic family protein